MTCNLRMREQAAIAGMDAQVVLSIAVVLLTCCIGQTISSCPCEDPSLCVPIKGTPSKEIFAFVTSQTNWPAYNWSLLTTVALFTKMNNSMLCHAHSQGVRVVLSASYPTSELQNSTQINMWIKSKLEAVQSSYADGLNIDIEGVITQNGTNQSGQLTQLVKDTVTAFKTANNDYQVTFDVAWSPNCIDGRCYDYVSLAKYTDFVVIMSYDQRSQIYGACTASANSALPITANGVQAFIDRGIPPENLVLGLPWYGYDYPCLSLTHDLTCTIPKKPFRGVECSDAAGKQRSYYAIRELIRASTTFVQWNATLQSPFFNYKNSTGAQHQVWFDNTESLTLKYMYAAERKLKGLAFWNIDDLNYDGSSHDRLLTEEMWEAILVFFDF